MELFIAALFIGFSCVHVCLGAEGGEELSLVGQST